MKKVIAILMIFTLMICTASCTKKEDASQSEDLTVKETAFEVVDMMGNTVSFDKPCEKIVSLSPSNTEILFALGVGDRVVGVTEYCNYPEEAKNKEKIGDFSNPNVELIRKINPDVIVSGGSIHEGFNGLNMKVVSTEAGNFSDIAASVRLLAKITGTEEKGEEIIANMDREIAAISEEAKTTIEKKPNIFYVVWDEPLSTAGNNTFINDVIKAAGGNNVAEKVEGWSQYSTEQLLADKVDYIIFAPHSKEEGITLEDIQKNEIYSKLDCVKEGKVHIMSNDDIISRAVPRVTEAIREIYEAIK